ncbi:MAG: 2-succinyl-5-enolpyruvyl-6-hydroxy-3-cyclohexene-1-carboxylic-acid synthase, partial [Streptosporangiaceae bacterium]
MNPATALARVLVDELARCGLREAVVAPGSRSAPLAMALHAAAGIRLHVRVDERSAAFLALGLAKASRRPVAVVCTSGTAPAHFHAAVIEADESGVPLLVLTADRPPELRGTGANQAVDQLKLYGPAVRWFCEVGVPEAGMAPYWRSLAGRAWAQASGASGGPPGPVHLNVAFREPLVPDGAANAGWDLAGRPDGVPWTRFAATGKLRAGTPRAGTLGTLELPWTERGVIICGDGGYDPAPLGELARAAGWPLLAEPSSGGRAGPMALAAYPYLLDSPEFLAVHRPDVIVSAGRPGLSRGQLAFLRGAVPGWPAPAGQHVVVTQGPGRWADPGR